MVVAVDEPRQHGEAEASMTSPPAAGRWGLDEPQSTRHLCAGGGGRGAENGGSVNRAFIPPMLFSKRCRSPTW
jgi:hypothetical protein